MENPHLMSIIYIYINPIENVDVPCFLVKSTPLPQVYFQSAASEAATVAPQQRQRKEMVGVRVPS